MTMSVRALAAVLTLAAAAGTAAAQEPATLLLRSGSRLSGSLVDMGGRDFTIAVNGVEQRIVIGDVAVIDFGGNASNLPAAETSRAGEGHLLVLRNGQMVSGQLDDIGGTTPLRITFRSGAGTVDHRSSDVLRIYLAPPPAGSTAAHALADPPAPTDPDPTEGKTIEVSAKVQWTRTGVTVRQGQVIRLTTRGTIRLSDDAGDLSGPAGREGRRAANAPLPNDLAGALIGRIGTGRPFGIGDQTSIPAPGTGELQLGINDDHVADNAGAFRVTIVTAATTIRRR